MEQTAIERTIELTGFNPSDAMAQPLIRRFAEEASREEELRRKYVSPAGTLNLPPLLDERRIQHAVPDHAFRVAGLFDRVMLWPLDDPDMAKGMASKHIVLTDVGQTQAKNESPRCLIIAAGTQALDALRSNGSDLGHIVFLLHLMPWWIPVGRSEEGQQWYVRVCSTGDLCGDEDLGRGLREGSVEILEDPEDGTCRIKRNGKLLMPVKPSMREDY